MSNWFLKLSKTIQDNSKQADHRFFHVANVDQNGMAQSRVMVFRGFDDGADCIFSTTDLRSDKVVQFVNHPYAHISWYFSQTREQFRLTVSVELNTHSDRFNGHSLDNYAAQIWRGLSDAAREQFTWQVDEQNTDKHTNINKPHKNFVLVKFTVLNVEYLDLREPIHKPIALKTNQ